MKGLDGRDVSVASYWDELSLYQTIIQQTLSPEFLFCQVSVNPPPVLGVWLKDNHKNSNQTSFGGNKGYIDYLISVGELSHSAKRVDSRQQA